MRRTVVRCVLGCVLVGSSAASAQVYRLPAVPDIHNPVLRQILSETRDKLTRQLSDLSARVKVFNTECARVAEDSPAMQRCGSQDAVLEGDRKRYNRGAEQFAQEVARARSLPASATAIWSVGGHVLLMHGLIPVRASDQVLRNGDCVRAFAGARALIVVPRGAFSIGPKSHFCYQPQNESGVIGVLGYLYRWEAGHEVRTPVTVVGVRG